MVAFEEIVEYGMKNKCSDIHLTANLPPMFRRVGALEAGPFDTTVEENDELVLSLLNDNQKAELANGKDIDFSYTTNSGYRTRVNVYRQQTHMCAAIRILNNYIPSLDDLGLPSVLKRLCQEPRGLILVTGPTGSGKSTTLAAMMDFINESKRSHIITIEDPIEYVYEHKNSMIHQREVGRDVESFGSALRSAMREDPDVILVGEMRDFETISAAITAAETGHLVFSTLHTTGAAQTIDRIVDVFPPHNQQQIRTQLAAVLRGVISQQLVPLTDGQSRTAAQEILLGTDAVANIIRENKCHQLNSIIQTGLKDGMQTLNSNLAALVKEGKITYETAMLRTNDKSELVGLLN